MQSNKCPCEEVLEIAVAPIQLRANFKGGFKLKMRRKNTRKIAGLLSGVAVMAIMAGCSKGEASGEEVTVAKEIPVEVAEVSYGSLSDSNRLTGTIIPETEVDVVPKAPGEIKQIMVQKGDIVKVGDVLARLDDSAERNAVQQQQVALKQAQSGLKSAQSGLSNAQSGKSKAAKSYEQAQASVRQVEASLAEARKSLNDNLDNIEFQIKNAKLAWDQAKQNVERMEVLLAEGLISQQNYDDASNGEQNARNAYEQVQLNKSQVDSSISLQSLEASLDQSKIGASIAQSSIQDADIGIRQAQAAVEQAQASVEQAQLAVDSARERLADKVIVATASGEITQVSGEVGAMASGQQPFASIVSIDKVKVSVNILPDQLSAFKQGTTLEVEVNGLKEAFTGTVTYVSTVGTGSGLFAVEAEIDNPNHVIRPGMVATIVVDEILASNTTLVPTNAVIQKEGESVVFTVVDGKSVLKEVEVIRYGTDTTAVAGDLTESEEVVVKGQNLLNDGDSVKIMKED